MRTIEIDNELILVEVPKDAKHFTLIESHNYFKSPRIEHSIGGFDLDRKFGYEIIGLIETPNVDFDFEVEDSWVESNQKTELTICELHKNYKTNLFSNITKKQSFRTRIQRKIQDAGIELTGNLLLIKKLK